MRSRTLSDMHPREIMNLAEQQVHSNILDAPKMHNLSNISMKLLAGLRGSGPQSPPVQGYHVRFPEAFAEAFVRKDGSR